MGKRIPVLVVGAGPAGLTAACELVRRGIECRVIDKLPEPSPFSKATVLWPRTLESLRRTGASEHILDAGNPLNAFQFYWVGKAMATLGFAGLDGSSYHRPLAISQAETEAALRDAFSESGGKIEWNTALTELRLFATHGEAVLETDGTSERVECEWVLGADGARSLVRKAMGFGLDGDSFPERFMLADCVANMPQVRDRGHFYQSPSGLVGIIPLPKGVTRVFAGAPEGRSHEDLTLDDFRERLLGGGAEGVDLVSANWMTVFTVHGRVVPNYRVGRGLLAGDAAHVNSPASGQGINLGIQDSVNLGWKLAQVVSGLAPESLLDGYSAERRAIAEGVIKDTNRQTKAQLVRNPLAATLRNHAFRLVAASPVGRRKIVPRMAGFKVGYRATAPVAGDPASRGTRRGPRAGDRLPDFRVLSGTSGAVRGLHETIASDRHVVLLLGGRGSRPGQVASLDELAEEAREEHGTSAEVYLVISNEPLHPRNVVPPRGDIIVDRDQKIHQWAHAKEPALCVVRPDGYLALLSSPPKIAELSAVPGLGPTE